MTGAVIATLVVCLIVIVVLVVAAFWLTLRRKHGKPSYQDAQGHFRLRKQVAEAGPEPVLATPDYVPNERVNPLDGLTVPQDPENGPDAGGISGRARRRPIPGD